VPRARRSLPLHHMVYRTGKSRATCLALLAALAACLTPAGVGRAAASAGRTISNVATIEWDEGGARLSRSSNQVDVVVEAASRPYALSTYRFSSNSGSVPVSVTAPRCTTAGGDAAVPLAAAWSGVALSPAGLTAVNEIHAGEPLVVVLDYADGNRDPSVVDSVTGAIVARSGDREILTFFETGPDTGKFAGYIQTVPAPPPGTSGDCRLTVEPGDKIVVESLRSGNQIPLVTAAVDVLVDPFGVVFDSLDAAPVSGTRITLLDAATGQPAAVFGDDGTAAFPASIVTGTKVQDSAGNSYDFGPGDYRFPFVRAGTYRLRVEPPAPYTAPSVRTPADLAGLQRPDGHAFTLVPGSYGATLTLVDPAPVRIDIPVDQEAKGLSVVKSASAHDAAPGESVIYTIDIANQDLKLATGALTLTDRFGPSMRFRAETLRVDGKPAVAATRADGAGFDLSLPGLGAGATARVRYALEVRADARTGDAVNQARVSDARGHQSNVADAAVRVRRDDITNRLTIEGRVVDGACGTDGRGIAGVRIMLEDGSYALTDPDGRYHFEGVVPGTHVVQLDDMTLPADRAPVDCARDTRSGGRAFSRFVEGQGGELKRVDFHAVASAPRADAAAASATRPKAPSDAEAAAASATGWRARRPASASSFPSRSIIRARRSCGSPSNMRRTRA
jgi:hypothetical protein